MIRINRLVPEGHATVYAKCEFFQPLNSVKDRIGAAMIAAGERDGKINADTHIVEPTSGNTGIGIGVRLRGGKATSSPSRCRNPCRSNVGRCSARWEPIWC